MRLSRTSDKHQQFDHVRYRCDDAQNLEEAEHLAHNYRVSRNRKTTHFHIFPHHFWAPLCLSQCWATLCLCHFWSTFCFRHFWGHTLFPQLVGHILSPPLSLATLCFSFCQQSGCEAFGGARGGDQRGHRRRVPAPPLCRRRRIRRGRGTLGDEKSGGECGLRR